MVDSTIYPKVNRKTQEPSFLTMGMNTCSVYSIFMTDMWKFSHQTDISYSHLFYSLKLTISKIMVKESACNAGDLGLEDPLEKEMAIHSSILAWKIPWTEEPHRLQSMGS